MTFEEYLRSAPEDKRTELFDTIKYYGDPDEILKEIALIPPSIQNKDKDVRINQNYLLYHQNKGFGRQAYSAIIAIKDIAYCYYGYEGSSFNNIGLLGNDGQAGEFNAGDRETSLRVYRKLRSYVKGLEDMKATPGIDAGKEIKVRERWGATYILKNNTIYRQKLTLFGGTKEKIQVQDINDIIWCVQCYDCDDGVTSYNLELNFLNSKNNCTLYFETGKIAFLFAMELKKRIPHLLYGCNPEYAAIYDRNPAALLQIGKDQARS